MWAFPRFANISGMYVLGVSNVVADFLSRHRLVPSQTPLPGEWRLNPEVVQMIWHRFGRANVDLFASEESTHCLLWFSWTEKSSTLGQDALAQLARSTTLCLSSNSPNSANSPRVTERTLQGALSGTKLARETMVPIVIQTSQKGTLESSQETGSSPAVAGTDLTSKS